MRLRMLFSRKYRVSKRFRFEVASDDLRKWFSEWWLLILSLVLLAIGLPLVLGFGLIEPESARWTLSALVQAGAALIGIFFLALGILWNQATQEREKLRGLMEGYMKVFADNSPAVIALHRTLADKSRDSSVRSSKDIREKFVDCFLRLVVLEYARTLYSVGGLTLDQLLIQAPIYGLQIDEGLKDKLNRQAIQLSLNEKTFFEYLLDFDNKLSVLWREKHISLLVELKELKGSKSSPILLEALWRARRVDRVGVSLYRIRFFSSFVGNGLKIVSLMWFLCLTIGLLLLVSLDRIPNHILPFLTSATVAIGVAALGTTLSLVFRAVRSSD